MPELVPCLRYTSRELAAMAVATRETLEGWAAQWCTHTPSFCWESREPMPTETAETAEVWGWQERWLATDDAAALQQLMHMVLFDEAMLQQPVHDSAERVMGLAWIRLCLDLLEVERVEAMARPTIPTFGRDCVLLIQAGDFSVRLRLSPHWAWHILQHGAYAEDQRVLTPIDHVLQRRTAHLDAIAGSAVLSAGDLSALAVGDVILLDGAGSLNYQRRPVAGVRLARSTSHMAVIVAPLPLNH